ncbi:RIMS-binding protein 2-like isoform X4 [Polypterus senegalus]|uniref:RIMS-binding protein 2-like isoform X4 n=1 Tax=Polypterus senegalus TaxID=55291 RepID=UPI0019662DCA|nr:RIMS-binding protein 2-like isoform X4 [Polypterus senegalus]
MDWLNGTDYTYLVKQNAELLRALDELEKSCTSLRQENSLLRKSCSPETEEKVKRLQQKNAELAVIAKRLEERARKLQEANLKVVNAPALVKGPGVEQYKKTFARQRARDLAAHAETLLAKDKEIEALRQECRELQFSGKGKQGISIHPGLNDFERLLRESQKEVLRLQRQLAVSSSNKSTSDHGQSKAEISSQEEEANGFVENNGEITQDPIRGLPGTQQFQQLETELNNKRKECEKLENEVRKRQKRCQDLESELEDVRSENAGLREKTEHLSQKAHLIDQIQLENNELRDHLSEVTAQRNSALEENQRLQAKLENLEQVLRHMREVAERRQQLEAEHEEALSILKLKQDEVKRLQKAQAEAKKEHEGVVQLLKDLIQLVLQREMAKVRELEEKCRSQSEQFGLLSHELERFRLQTGKIDVLTANPETTASTELTIHSKMTLCNGVDLPDEKHVETNSGSASLTKDIKNDINTISEELCIQQKESAGISAESGQDPTPSRPQSESKHVTPDSEFIPQSTPKSCTTSEVDTASEVEDLDFDVSPVPEPEMRVPAKLQVFIARYSYNPFKGPNKNPEAELPLTAGEYIYVYGEMDEDGFYEGELMDGRRGLVPSNFVERVSDDDVMSVHPPEVSDLSHNSYQESSFHSSSEKNLRLSVNSLEKNELCLLNEEITNVTGKADSLMTNGFDLDAEEVGDDVVPYPRKLTLIKQLAKSIIISWEPPLVPAGWGNIWSYNLYVDKELRLNVPFGSQTKAVLGQLDVSLKAYRVSVQSISEKGNSDQLCCSFLVGRDVCVAPTQLKVGSVTATSACLSWLPSNSNFTHIVYLNEEEYEIVKAGNYSLCLTNLRPHMRYKVRVEARPNRTPWELSVHHRERKCACTAFETLMAGPPDAPLDVQVEPGPSPGIALVSWLPVTIDAAGTSNGVRVTGYVIYADTQKVLEVASPTAGSVLVGPSQIHILQASKELTVRTMSMYGESVDSASVKIPSKLFAATAHCPPLQKFPSASNSSDICVHMVPPYRDSLETTAAKSSLLPSLPDATASSSEQTPDTFLNSNPGGEQAETYQEDQISMDFRTDSLINTSSEFNSVALHAEVQDLELEPMAGISSSKDRLLNPSKDCESSSSKYPTDSYSREADVSCSEDLSESVQAKNIRGLDQEEEEEKGAKANARVVSIEEFLDDCEEKQELTEQPGQTKNDLARPEKAKEVCLVDVPQPVCYSRLNEYHNDSSRGSDLSDILEEDEEELCSDTAGNEDDKDALCQANLGVSVKAHSDTWETDSDEEILEKILELPLQTHHNKELFSIPEVTEEEDESLDVEEAEQPSRTKIQNLSVTAKPSAGENLSSSQNCKVSCNRSHAFYDEEHSAENSCKHKKTEEAINNRHKLQEQGNLPLQPVNDESFKSQIKHGIPCSRSRLHPHKDPSYFPTDGKTKYLKHSQEDFDSDIFVYVNDKENKSRRGHKQHDGVPRSPRDVVSAELRQTTLKVNKYYPVKASKRHNTSAINGGEIDIEYGTEDDEEAATDDPSMVDVVQMHSGWQRKHTASENLEETKDNLLHNGLTQSSDIKTELKKQMKSEDTVLQSRRKQHHWHHDNSSVGSSTLAHPASHSRGKGCKEIGDLGIHGNEYAKAVCRKTKSEQSMKGQHSDELYSREIMANNDSRNLSGSLKRLSNELVPNTEQVDSRPYKEAQRTASTPDKPISSEVEDYPGESNVRIFVALFDYDPATMSLNPDAVEAELPFKDGQIIKVYGDKDADGFYRGESGGRFGYVPSNMVSEILAEDAETKEQVLRQGYLWPQGTSKNTGTRSHTQLPRRPVPPPKPRRSKKVDSTGALKESVNPSRESFESHSEVPVATPRRMVAIFDYDPRESSPNIDVEAELTFSSGDIIEVFGEMDDDGFFYGSLNGLQGLVPSNFLQAIPENEEVSEVISEEGKPQEGLRESQVSPDASKEKNDSVLVVSEDMLASNKQSNALVTLSEDLGCSGFTTGNTYPQALTPDSPSKDENSLQGKKKKGFFSKGKKLFKKFGSSKKD